MNRLNKGLLFLVITSLISCIVFFVTCWKYSYHSDVVLTGIAADRLISHGELPIFVGGVGYQGLLLEVPMAAFLFKIFGSTPMVLNLVPAFFYAILILVFYHVCRITADKTTSLLATLILILGPLSWYGLVLRTMPNYPQTYLSGLLLFLIYRSSVKKILLEYPSSSLIRPAILFGLLAGFALYTYGQIVYFFLAIFLHVSLFYFRAEFTKHKSRMQLLLPFTNKDFSLDKLVQWGCLLAMVLSIIAAFGLPNTVYIGKNQWQFVLGFFLFFVFYFLLHAYNLLRNHTQILIKYIPVGFCLGIAFIVGYAPKLYYNKVLKFPSKSRLNIGGTFEEFLLRFKLLWDALKDLYQSSIPFIPTEFFCIMVTGVFCYFIYIQSKTCLRFIESKTSLNEFDSVSILYLLIPCSLLPVLCSPAFTDLPGMLYALVLLMPFALGFAILINREQLLIKYKAWTLALLCLFLFNNIYNYRIVKNHIELADSYLSIIQSLKQRNAPLGYAEYWYSYALNFLDKEIHLESLKTNYFPYYQKQVHEAKRIALVNPAPAHARFSEQKVLVEGKTYQIVERFSVSNIPIYILEKIQ